MTFRFRIAVAFAALVLPGLAHSEPARVGLGAALVPQYEGSSSFNAVVAPSFAFSLGQIDIKSAGPGVQIDLISRRGFDAGPSIRWNGGRDPAKIDNAAVSALPKVNGAPMIGGFARLSFPVGEGVFAGPGVEILKGVGNGHKGLTAEGSLSVTKIMPKMVLGARATATYADNAYTSAFFDVATGSGSGLAAFDAGAGIKDIGVSAFATYKMTDNWSLTGVAGLKRLVGDAANSPVTSVAGNATQPFISFGLSYTFN